MLGLYWSHFRLGAVWIREAACVETRPSTFPWCSLPRQSLQRFELLQKVHFSHLAVDPKTALLGKCDSVLLCIVFQLWSSGVTPSLLLSSRLHSCCLVVNCVLSTSLWFCFTLILDFSFFFLPFWWDTIWLFLLAVKMIYNITCSTSSISPLDCTNDICFPHPHLFCCIAHPRRRLTSSVFTPLPLGCWAYRCAPNFWDTEILNTNKVNKQIEHEWVHLLWCLNMCYV